MATSSLIFLAQLLFITAGNLILAAPVNDFCGKTRDPPRCVALLKATDVRTPTATPVVLEEIAIEAAQGAGGNGKIAVQQLATFEKDPNLKKIYTNCADQYATALDELNFGQENLQKRRYAKLVRTGEIVFHVVGGCAGATQKKPSLNKDVDDTGVLGQVIGIIARAL